MSNLHTKFGDGCTKAHVAHENSHCLWVLERTIEVHTGAETQTSH